MGNVTDHRHNEINDYCHNDVDMTDDSTDSAVHCHLNRCNDENSCAVQKCDRNRVNPCTDKTCHVT